MSATLLQPGDIAMLGDDVLVHFRHCSVTERAAIGLYIQMRCAPEIDHAAARAVVELATNAVVAAVTGAT